MSLHREAQDYLSKNDSRLAPYIAQWDCTITPHTDYYKELVSSIISQQLSTKAASTIFNRFLALFNDTIPTPEQILQTDREELRSIGCSYAKASYILDLAQHVKDGRLDLELLSTLPNDQIISQLTAVKGIGVWSAHMFMIFSLGRLDILPTGDLGIKKGIMKLYSLPTLPSPHEIEQIAMKNNWPPYESIASWYVWKALDPA